MAVQLEKPYEMVMALVAGGAHLDYRASDSMTPIHRASEKGNYEAIKVSVICLIVTDLPLKTNKVHKQH